jgi:hypothetical protein
MGTVIDFPSLANREWIFWEKAIREANSGTAFDLRVADEAMSKIHEHWTVLFQPVTLTAPQRAMPGTLTSAQARAIQSVIDDGSQLFIEYHKQQRSIALGRLISCELKLAYYRVRDASSA